MVTASAPQPAVPRAGADRPAPPPAAGRPLPPLFSAVLALLLLVAAGYGLLVGDAYRLDADLTAQAHGQDALTLLTLPVLLWASVRARAGAVRAHLLWLGLLLYVLYGYASYVFSVPHNDAFLLYTTVLTMASYGLADGLLRLDVAAVADACRRAPRRGVSWLLLVTAAAFAALWLADIVPAIGGGLPAELFTGEQPNPIYVLDLAWLLPAVAATGMMLRRDRPAGPALAAVLLCKILTLSLACLSMTAFNLVDGNPVDPVLPVMFIILTAVTSGLLTVGAHRFGSVPAGWLRPSVWSPPPSR